MLVRSPISSGLKEADAVIKATPGFLHGISCFGDGTNLATAKVYNDAAAATGTLLGQAQSKVEGDHVWFDPPVPANVGMYFDINGTNADAIVYWS